MTRLSTAVSVERDGVRVDAVGVGVGRAGGRVDVESEWASTPNASGQTPKSRGFGRAVTSTFARTSRRHGQADRVVPREAHALHYETESTARIRRATCVLDRLM